MHVERRLERDGVTAPLAPSQVVTNVHFCHLNPHFFLWYRDRSERNSSLPNVLHMIGNTPLVRLDKIARSEGLECDLCEHLKYTLSYFLPFQQHV